MEKFPCPGCAAGMEFDPQTAGLKCPYCGATAPVPEDAAPVVEQNYEAFVKKLESEPLRPIAENALEVNCSTCGAAVAFQPPEVAGVCPFCASAIVMQPKSAEPLIAPQGVLPFHVPKPQATSIVKQWLGNRWFAPGDLQRLARTEAIAGVYLPVWTFDAVADSDYIGQRGEYYYVTETYSAVENGRPVTRTRQVRHTRWHPAAGHVQNTFDDLLVPGSRSVDQDRFLELEPWRMENIKPYEPSYLAGFKAQRYQVALPEAFETAREMTTGPIRNTVCADIGGDEQRILQLATTFSEVTFKHLLLPAWIGAYRYQGKVYQVLVNAWTGEVQGARPYSAAKIALLVLGILLAIFILWIVGKSG